MGSHYSLAMSLQTRLRSLGSKVCGAGSRYLQLPTTLEAPDQGPFRPSRFSSASWSTRHTHFDQWPVRKCSLREPGKLNSEPLPGFGFGLEEWMNIQILGFQGPHRQDHACSFSVTQGCICVDTFMPDVLTYCYVMVYAYEKALYAEFLPGSRTRGILVAAVVNRSFPVWIPTIH